MVETYFDTAERTDQLEITSQSEFIKSFEIVVKMLESYPQIGLIIDLNRQIVSANKNALYFLNNTNLSEILGKRFGEALNCVNAFEMKAGCGTSIFCKECGAAKSIKLARETGVDSIYECRINTKKDNLICALDLRVITVPIEIGNKNFLLLYVENIAAEKRKDALERVFFHDILNTAGVIKNIVDILPEIENKEELISFYEILKNSSLQLLNEIQFQRMIVNAEKNELFVELEKYSVNEILDSAYKLYSRHNKAEGKIFTVELLKNDLDVKTDKTLLVRSIGNLIKNALEATSNGQEIKLYATIDNKYINFNVWNQGIIPEDIQLQIFQRSFSTKAKSGRGLGTYSVKMFVENYLNGKVYFKSSYEEQTCFTISLPIIN